MARRRRSNSVRRVTFDYSNRRLSGPIRRSSLPRLSSLRAIEDRREFHPEGDFRPARGFVYPRHRLVVSVPRQEPSRLADTYTPVVPLGVSFKAPRQVAICVRRKQRREVLHAMGKTGRGSRFNRAPRRNVYSEVSC